MKEIKYSHEKAEKIAEKLTEEDIGNFAHPTEGCWSCGSDSNLWLYYEKHGVPHEEQTYCFPCLKSEIAETYFDDFIHLLEKGKE